MRGGLAALTLALLLVATASFAQSADDLLEAGKKAFSDGFFAVAAGSFQRILSNYPHAAAAMDAEYMLGVSNYYAGKWQECLVVLEGFQNRHPSSVLASRASYWVGAAYLRQGSYEKAFRSLSSQVAGPYSLHAALLCGVALEGLGRDSEAAGFYRKVMTAGDQSLAPEAVYRLAGTEYRAGHYADAQDLFGRILLDFPQSPYVRDSVFFLAETELAQGNLDSAERRLTTIITLYPDSPYREAAFYRLADIAYRRHSESGSLRRLDELARLFPQGAYRGSAERMRADILFDQKKYEEAASEYERSIADLGEGSGRQSAWYSLGLADLMLNRKTRAAQAFAEAGVGVANDLGEKATFQRALLLAGLDRSEEAIQALEDLLRSFRQGAHAEEGLKLLASLLDSRMDFDKSFARWDSLVKQYPRSVSLPEYLYRRGVVRMYRGDPGALDDFQKVIRDFPASAFRDESEYSVGYAYSRRGEYARAIPYFQTVALRAAGSDVGDRSSLAIGVCLFNMGSFEKALASLEYLKARQPGPETQAIVALYTGRTLYRMEKLPAAAERLAAASQMFEGLEQPSTHAAEAADALYWLGWSLYRTGKLTDARDAFLSLAKRHSSDSRSLEAVYRAGVCETVSGNDAAAVALFETVARGEERGSVDQWHEQALYEKGWALSRMGSRQESLEAFQELSARFPNGQLAPEAFFKLAMMAYDEGRYLEAKSGFQAVIHDFPSSVLVKQALSWKAECTRQSGDPEAALDEFWICITSDPGPGVLSIALQGFSECLKSVSKVETARDFVQRAQGTQGLDVQVVASVALDYVRMLLPRDPTTALAVLEDLSRRSPPEPLAGQASLLMGQAFSALSEWQRALDILAQLSDNRADEVGAQATEERARVLEATGDLREAMNQHLRIAYLFPTYADLAAEGMYNAARLAVQLGDGANAARIAEGLRRRYPASPWTARLEELSLH